MIQVALDHVGTLEAAIGQLVAVCVSRGSIPKQTMAAVPVTMEGLEGDGHAHAKHNRPDRAISLFDLEILTQLQKEGFPLYPGAIGENLTVVGLHVQRLPPGTLLKIGDVLLQLVEPRKPCYVLDAINPCLKDVIVGRCGYMASVVQGGIVEPGMEIVIVSTNHARVHSAR
jgi:MOSC domain-containing protein YiiM